MKEKINLFLKVNNVIGLSENNISIFNGLQSGGKIKFHYGDDEYVLYTKNVIRCINRPVSIKFDGNGFVEVKPLRG